ncbi:MAG: AraC family transcriptional regulator [Roseivirga sp.]|nr:AraC family transcriptional regulator [Roseivirga sp.]
MENYQIAMLMAFLAMQLALVYYLSKDLKLLKSHVIQGETGLIPSDKYQKNKMSDQYLRECKDRLLHLMEQEKIYREPCLTLNRLAKKLDLAPHHLSQVINTSIGSNFFNFVNYYRIQECSLKLSQFGEDEKNVSEIFYESGFSSKSAFYEAFKKCTGMTPREFRKAQKRIVTSLSA